MDTHEVSRRPFVGGNWKMNLTSEGVRSLGSFWRGSAVADQIRGGLVEVCVFAPFPYLMTARDALRGSGVRLGAQDVFTEPSGAYTGEVSASMLLDCGVSHVLVGHSERRHIIGEPDELVARKVRAAVAAGLVCVLCIGETLEQRERGETDRVTESQLRSALEGAADRPDRLVVAYEPVWAIGTGRNASPDDAQRAHGHIRGVLASLLPQRASEGVRVIYGGSVRESNAGALFAQADVDGGLVGGASLDAREFLAIVGSAVFGSDR